MVSCTALIGLVLAAGPSVTVQGSLSNAGGAVSGTYDLTVSLYTSETAGVASHTSLLLDVPVEGGVFSGLITNLPPDGITLLPNLWVGVRVENEPELPRTPLGATIQALTAWVSLDVSCSACVDGTELADESVGTNTLVPGAVDGTRLADYSVSESKITPGAVTTPALAEASVTSAKLADGHVTTEKLATLAVTTAILGNGAVTQPKLGPLAVGTAQLAPLAVTTDKLAFQAVTTDRIATAAVTSDQLALGAVISGRIADDAVTNPKIAPGAIMAEQIATSAVTSSAIAAQAVKASHLSLTVLSGSFCDNTSPTVIPGSAGAIYCGLAYVDDDAAAAWCSVKWDGTNWVMQTGAGCGGNACAYTCIK